MNNKNLHINFQIENNPNNMILDELMPKFNSNDKLNTINNDEIIAENKEIFDQSNFDNLVKNSCNNILQKCLVEKNRILEKEKHFKNENKHLKKNEYIKQNNLVITDVKNIKSSEYYENIVKNNKEYDAFADKNNNKEHSQTLIDKYQFIKNLGSTKDVYN